MWRPDDQDDPSFESEEQDDLLWYPDLATAGDTMSLRTTKSVSSSQREKEWIS